MTALIDIFLPYNQPDYFFRLCVQFETDGIIDTTLSMNEDLYNAKYKDKLELEHKVIL